jgi:hypothetical protein
MHAVSRLLGVVLLCCSASFGWKLEAHLLSMPVMAGAGAYASVKMLQDSHLPASHTAAFVNLGLLGGNAVIGALGMFGRTERFLALRNVHRAIGVALFPCALWLCIAADGDRGIRQGNRNVGYGYTAITAMTILTFSF